MTATVDEIADGIYRLSTFSPTGPPGGITFNQFLVVDDEPMLVHTGMKTHFRDTLAAVASVLPPDRLRWITSNHASRPDELGALDEWFAAAPHAAVVHGEVACRVNLVDVTARPLRAVADGEVVEIGRARMRWMATPHVPGPWEAGFWLEEHTAVLFTGDVFAQSGPTVAVTTDDVVAPAIAHDERGHGTALTPSTAPTLRRLADLEPAALALMHGPTMRGAAAGPLRALADHFASRFHDRSVDRP